MSQLLNTLRSPVLFFGDNVTAFRDPAAFYHDGVFHLFFTLVETDPDGKVYMVTAHAQSADLAKWTPPRPLTPRDQTRNFSSPGNVIRVGNEWILCLQTYPRPGGAKYGDNTSRLWTMRSRDLQNWDEPELLRVKGPDTPVEAMGRMIDPFLLAVENGWRCFYKQNGVSVSWSPDLLHWRYEGRADAGENVCVLPDTDRGGYLLFHSPPNGVGILRSDDLANWQAVGYTTLGQAHWPWAQGRLTAGFVLDLRSDSRIGKYVMFFHGSGPEDEDTYFDTHASIGVAWSDDLATWEWPQG